MPGGGRIEQTISKISLFKKTEGYLMSVAQCGQACVVADISPFVGQNHCHKEEKLVLGTHVIKFLTTF